MRGRPSATWCCNPQFKLAARKAGELLLCLSQRDPMLAHGRHVPKARREARVGFQVRAFLSTQSTYMFPNTMHFRFRSY